MSSPTGRYLVNALFYMGLMSIYQYAPMLMIIEPSVGKAALKAAPAGRISPNTQHPVPTNNGRYILLRPFMLVIQVHAVSHHPISQPKWNAIYNGRSPR